ncbi:MAG: tRNA pseudouridine(55) synthase TruB [Bacillota bacterium]|nr:tRNA pseudouridine(55) synthase TruB [Bacillota bacterium]
MRDGILILDKPQEWTSSDCVAICRRAFRCKGIKKVGHGGTLDPMATGVLPIFIGQATRIMEYLDLDMKTYRCSAALGKVTDTLDIWGQTLDTQDYSHVTADALRQCLESFKGWIWQTPPKYSAVRINGKRLYEYAYKGQEVDVDIKQRNVNIQDIQLISCDMEVGAFVFDVTCSKGTYVRTICSDIGDQLGCGCVMTALTRTKVGNISLDGAPHVYSPLRIKELCSSGSQEEIESFAEELYGQLLPADYPLIHFGKIRLSEDRVRYFSRGNSIRWNQVNVTGEPDRDYMHSVRSDGSMPLNARGRRYDRIYRIYEDDTGAFIGTGYYDKDERLLKADKVFIEKRP